MAGEATKIPFIEGSAPSTPAANRSVIYVKSDGLFYSKDDAGTETLMSSGSSGSMATDALWDAAGDLAQGTGANAGAKLSAGSTAQVLTSAGAAAANAWKYPPDYQFDYAEVTSGVNLTATTEGTANTVVTGNSVTYDGSTQIMVEFWAPDVQPGTTYVLLILYDDTAAASLGYLSFQNVRCGVHLSRKLTPASGARVYSIRGFVDAGTGAVNAAAGGAGNRMPGYIRITKVA